MCDVIFNLYNVIFNIYDVVTRSVDMKAVLEAYLKKNIDDNIKIYKWRQSDKFPIFLKEVYHFYSTEILGRECLLLEIFDEATGIAVLKKHIKVIKNIVDNEVVLVYKTISRFRKKSLIQQRVPFIVKDKQMYLPFLGLDLKEVKDKPKKEIKAFSDSAQLTFLYFLYHKDIRINGTGFAEMINVTVMTASRILSELYSLGLLTYEIGGKTGRSKEYKRIEDPEYYEVGSKYLKNPVKNTVYVEKTKENYPIAGLEALSMISMINPPDRKIRAIYKKDFYKTREKIIVDKAKIMDEKTDELQAWCYDSTFLSKNNIVDLVSLSASLSEIKDERIEQAIENSMEAEEWYMG